MLVQRQQDGDLISALYESSNVIASRYDLGTQQLTIVFKSGVGYVYEAVDRKDYAIFELADSQGKIFNKSIKHHTFKTIGEVNMDEFMYSLKEAKLEEIKSLNRSIGEVARKLAVLTEEDGLDEEALVNIQTLIRMRSEKLQ